ncbi:hypothetical protein ACJJTC_007318 [Scirpophaga incertulas]
MDAETIIVASVLGSACLTLFVLVMVLFVMVASLRKTVREMQATGRIRVQKLRMSEDKNHAFHNPGLVPDEELSKRGYSMYVAEDVESQNRAPARERQAGGELVDELQREIDSRQQRSTAPPFLLQAIQENKRKSQSRLQNPVSNGRQSDTNPNFMY